jgi:hypothetical protein
MTLKVGFERVELGRNVGERRGEDKIIAQKLI